jgi:signal transduction histidine kinase
MSFSKNTGYRSEMYDQFTVVHSPSSQTVSPMKIKERGRPLQKKADSDIYSSDQRSLQQEAKHTTWWHSPFIGYPACVLLVCLAHLVAQASRIIAPGTYFPSSSFFLVTVFVALFWGVGPSLLAILLGFIDLNFFVLPHPQGGPTFSLVNDIIAYGPFLLAQLIVTIITAQRERAHRRIVAARHKEHRRSEERAKANAVLTLSNLELEQADQIKDLFLSRAAHELKTPLTSIQGQIQLTLRLLDKQEELPCTQSSSTQSSIRMHLEKADAQTHRLRALIDNLLDLSTLRSGKMPLHLAQCAIDMICREVVEDQRTLADRPIKLTTPAEPINVRADSERLTQLILNLVSNAIKYASEESEIVVSIEQVSDFCLLQVYNSHPAIPAEYLPNLFEPFYRSPNAFSSKRQGWGLGLAISKEIVEQHRGRIWVESSEEKGTTFCVELPIEH